MLTLLFAILWLFVKIVYTVLETFTLSFHFSQYFSSLSRSSFRLLALTIGVLVSVPQCQVICIKKVFCLEDIFDVIDKQQEQSAA